MSVRYDEDGCPYTEGPGGQRLYTAEANQAGPGLLADVRNGKWLDAQHFPPLEYAVPNVIPEGFTLLVGPPKIGKSWFVLATGLGVTLGGRVLGQVPVTARPVFYLALEDGDRRLQDRCRRVLGDDPIPEAFEYVTAVAPGQALDTVEAWLGEHPGARPLVILDTLGKVMPPALLGESSYQRDYRVGSTLKRIIDAVPGAALVVNHHDRKAGAEDFVDSVSGTHGLAGAADTIVVLNRARHERDGLLNVTGRDVAEGEYAVRFDINDLWQLEGASFEAAARAAEVRKATRGTGESSTQLIEFVFAQPGPVSVADVAAGLGIDKAKANTYLARAVEAGRLRRLHRGLYSPVRSVRLLDPEEPSPNGISQSHTSNTPLGGGA